MTDSNRKEQIKREITRIEQSTLSAKEYIQRYGASFSLSQFYRYRTKFNRDGMVAQWDRRKKGNHRKLDQEKIAFLRGFSKDRSDITPSEAQQALVDEFGVQVHRSTISRILKKLGIVVTRKLTIVKNEKISYAGFELIAALAIHLGWVKHTSQCIMSVISIRRGENQWNSPVDKKGRNERGQFTKEYNQQESVQQMRFASIELKRFRCDFGRMDLFKTTIKTIERKVLAILALPLITLNGEIRHVNTVLGNALQGFCGYNYKQATLERFLRELKYLGISEELLCSQIRFWHEKWQKNHSQLELPFLCYYIDGNIKPVWSKYRVKQNKVTMLGRVMGSLEQVFVNDCFGHPIYFETYSGHAPMGVYTLSLMEKVEQYLEGIEGTTFVNRVLVMDGLHNSVETLRALAKQNRYHYITTLDDNQWSERKIRFENLPERDQRGTATLYDGEIELEDSFETGYLITVRTIRVEWDNGKRTVLLTSLLAKMVGPSLVVKGYFERWPQQELVFRGMKGFSSLHRVAGYGSPLVEEPKVREKQQELEEKLQFLKVQLQKPLEELAQETEALTVLIEKERVLRAKSRIENGKRILESSDMKTLQTCTNEIKKVQQRMKTIENAHKDGLKTLHKCEASFLRLQGKEVVYQIDVELDQILTYFRVSLSNICAYFLKEDRKMSPLSFSTLMQSILFLNGEVEETHKQRRIVLMRNSKEPALMKKLEKALIKLNSLSLKTLSGKHYEFFLS